MRTYKSIERPSQVLGIDVNNLFVVMGVVVVGAILVGLLSMVMDVHWIVYVLLLLLSVSLFLTFKYLAKHRPPGFAMGFVSYHLRQPKRLSIGLPRNAKAKAAAKAKMAASAKKPAPKPAAKAKAKAPVPALVAQ
jgi:hypothetical protein